MKEFLFIVEKLDVYIHVCIYSIMNMKTKIPRWSEIRKTKV